MKRPDFDNMTEKEKRQFGDYVNLSLRRIHAAQQRRKRVSEARNKIESEVNYEFESETA